MCDKILEDKSFDEMESQLRYDIISYLIQNYPCAPSISFQSLFLINGNKCTIDSWFGDVFAQLCRGRMQKRLFVD